jgi:probable HAF family extracellular repeat protein
MYSSAFGINDYGHIVGQAQTADGEMRAALWIPVPEPETLILFAVGILLFRLKAANKNN